MRLLQFIFMGLICTNTTAFADEDSFTTACSMTNLKNPDKEIPQIPDIFQPPVMPGLPEGIGTGTCRGWNACPCREDCEKKVIASCEKDPLE